LHLGGLALPESTEYKVLRIFSRPMHSLARPTLTGLHQHHLFEVFTISGASGSRSSHAQWKFVDPGSAIVVGEVVYFKEDAEYDEMIGAGVNPGVPLDSIYSFDLEREEWRGILQGPIHDIFQTGEYDDDLGDYLSLWYQTTLADLRGSLALLHYREYQYIMDLWLLKTLTMLSG